MPRTYKYKTESCDPDVLQAAIYKVENDGASIRSAAKSFGIARETLRRWITDKPAKAKAGRMRVLTDEEEELIIVALEKCSALAWPCGTEEITLMIKTYLDSAGKKQCLRTMPLVTTG